MNVPATAPNFGTALLVDRFVDKTVLVGGTFTGSMKIQGSIDGTNWADITSAITTPSSNAIDHTVKYLRVNLTALSAGTPVVWFDGLDTRTT